MWLECQGCPRRSGDLASLRDADAAREAETSQGAAETTGQEGGGEPGQGGSRPQRWTDDVRPVLPRPPKSPWGSSAGSWSGCRVTSSETLSLSYAHEEDDANSPAVPTLGSELWLEVVATTA